MKEKHLLEIAGLPITIVSDEDKLHIEEIAAVLDERIRDLTVRNKRCSKIDAALLCALDYCSEAKKNEKKIRNLEAQIALYEANLKRYREENTELKGMINELEATPAKIAKSEIPPIEDVAKAEEIELDADAGEDAEEAPTPEEYKGVTEEEKAIDAIEEKEDGEDRRHRLDQLRQIESLLRMSGSSGDENK